APLSLDGEEVELVGIRVDGATLESSRYERHSGGLVIPDLPGRFVLETETLIAPERNSTLSGLYTSGGNFYTQCEAEGFRRITFFPDRPDVMARFSTTIEADRARYPVLLSNGNPAGAGDAADGRHWARWIDPHPKPCYLFALVAGDLIAARDTFTTRSGKHVALAIWVRRGDEDKCAHAMRSLKAAMKWDEDVFGLEYDLDVFNIAAVSDFNMGAMENKGLNIFNSKYVLARPDTATDADYESIETVIGHEYFHNWTGDRVTCRDWFQLSLKEGLTVFRDQEFSADLGSRAVKRLADVRRLRAGQFPEDDGPLAHPVRPDSYMQIDNFYTATVYQKGAEVVRMLHTLIGPANFRKGMDLYIERHDNQAVTIEDFVAAMQDASGVDLSQFSVWYSQAGTPVLSVEDTYDRDARRYTLSVRQTTKPTPGQATKRALPIPLAMGLLDPSGAELPTRLAGENTAQRGTRVLLLDGDRQDFVFEDVPLAPVPSLLRNFSAPVKLTGVPRERLHFLAARDTDPFVRWDSGQQYATAALLDLITAQHRGAAMHADAGLIEAIAATLAHSDADPAFAAEALSLPSEAFVADQMEIADPDAIHAARDFLRTEIGRTLGEALSARYAALAEPGAYRIDGHSIGKRALRNVCLAYLAAGQPDGIRLAKTQFDTNRNMTDQLAALGVLSQTEAPERQAALETFYQRWRGDDLVLDKWFAIQAVSSRPRALADVEALYIHPDFDIRNPNRVRALVSAFASGNQVRFHDASGAGYRFLADAVVALDRLNPQVAARIVTPLGLWRRQSAARQALMQGELQRILATPGLSKNTYEQVSKSLA
ncbi:MAG: aminopeptidase N, partial [Alphaproteobacteria bacterium]|nr:aminopeptidase N [Alphaproteobacteria bacterium]